APRNPVYLSESFMGPSTTNSLGKKFFEGQTPPVAVGDDGVIAAGPEATGRATLSLRQTLLTFDQRKRGAIDAMAYGLSLGVTTHLDQGAFQATNASADGAAHEDNYTMPVPFITEPWLRRLNALRGGVSLTGWRYLAGTPEQNGPPFRLITDTGIPAGMSSDGMQIAPMNPWLHMYYATTGLNARQVLINGD